MASMKLRVRAASGGPTIKVQVPLLCTLEGLKDVLEPLISLPASSFSLSLDKKKEFQGPGFALLSSLGVRSGDLLFYSVNSGRSSSPLQQLTGSSSRVAGSTTPTESRGVAPSAVPTIYGLEASPSRRGKAVESKSTSKRELCAAAASRRVEAALVVGEQISTVSSDSASLGEQIVGASDSTASPGTPISPSSSTPPTIAEGGPFPGFEIDETRAPEMLPRGRGHRLVSIPDLLQRVLTTEFENIRQRPMCMILAVHAVMLETGFLRVETGSNRNRAGSSTLEGYELPSGWSDAGLVNLTYTLPELTRTGTSRDLGHEALLRCQVVGNAVVVYGAVTGGSVHRVSLPVSKFLQETVVLRYYLSKFSDDNASSSGGRSTPENESAMEDVGRREGSSFPDEEGYLVPALPSMGDNYFRNIFELWKEVKDSLSVPLLTSMCERTGLPPPPSLLRLPTELKIKVLDALPAVALANLACSCSEFRFLASNEELWKQKYKDEFGAIGERAPGGHGWKSAFVREFEHRKRREVERREAERLFFADSVLPGDFYQLRPPYFSPHFVDYSQGLGGPTSYNNMSGDERMGRGLVGTNGFGVPLSDVDYERVRVNQMGPSSHLCHIDYDRSRSLLSQMGPSSQTRMLNRLRSTFARLDGDDIGRSARYRDGGRGFGGVGPSS